MIDPDAALAFLSFVEARHEVWQARQRGEKQPWTADPIVASHKFTNVFRVLDYGSQFVLTDLLEPELPPEEFLMRCFLYRHTNLPSAWMAYRDDRGRYPRLSDLDDLLAFWNTYRGGGGRVFSGAYMIYPQSSTPGTDKVESVIRLTQRLFCEGDFTTDFFNETDQRDRFNVLRRNKGVADFMSMQILTDFGYSTEDRENEFIVPGPGARKGAAALDPKAKPEDIILWAAGAIQSSPGCPELVVQESRHGSMGRQPSLMDVQNCLCEFSKYARYSPREHPYSPTHPGLQLAPVIPAHW